MDGSPFWLNFFAGLMAAIWVASLLFTTWTALSSRKRRDQIQYLLVRLFFFKGFGLGPGETQTDNMAINSLIARVRILRLAAGGIAVINFITALVLAITGWWLLSFVDEQDPVVTVLVVIVAPLLGLIGLYSLMLLFLLGNMIKRLKNSLIDIEAGNR